ncbi:MAG: hypothetical protein LQ345_001383 [Seirophora villosa]|nr:MAG: hypothetical protein LQ345_001383 [Seirophora villosa]
MTPKGSRSVETTQNDQISDPRFVNIQRDPRFRLPSKRNTHVQIDKRFERMLRDEAFSSRARVDRYGRKLPKGAGKKELEKYYRFQDDQDLPAEDEQVESELQRANAEGNISSSAEESSSEEDNDLDVTEEEEVFGILDGQEADGEGIPVGEVTSRLAVVNLDWDNIRAVDLMAVFSSFVSDPGQIKRISVYPSDFGKERMEREEIEGPPKEIFTTGKGDSNVAQGDSESGDPDDDGSGTEEDDERIKKSLLHEDTSQDFDSARLRRYQLERLRYYYAVLVCSSLSVAQSIYEAVDGTEYLTTANFFDLRFIPNDTDFSHDRPRDECARIPDGYRPNGFVTDALQHSKVRLTWDAEDGTRKEAQKRAFSASRANIEQNDLKAYLGSDTSDDDDDAPEPVVVDATMDTAHTPEQSNVTPSAPTPKLSRKEANRQRMRALLGLEVESNNLTSKKSKSDQSAPVGDMQITFSSGLTTSTTAPNNSVFTNTPDDREETTVERYVRKEKERKARRKSKLKSLGEGGDLAPGISLNDSTAPGEVPPNGEVSPQEDKEDDLGFSDPFFADPSSKPTATQETPTDRKEAKRLKKSQREAEEAASAAQRAELELLTLPDDDPANENGLSHFDIKDILKAEKALAKSKKSKKRKASDREKEKEALKVIGEDKFKLNVQDPRFGAVFERPEFAIDPSHPRYMGTGGMQQILEEGRRKRRGGDDDGRDGIEDGKKREKRENEVAGEGNWGDDVERLVKKIKGRSKG